MQSPLESHWQVVKRILSYLSSTLDYGLVLRKNKELAITRFCEADWASDLNDQRSTTGYCVFLRSNLIS